MTSVSWLETAVESLTELPATECFELPQDELAFILTCRPRVFCFGHRPLSSLRHPNVAYHRGVLDTPPNATKTWGIVANLFDRYVAGVPNVKAVRESLRTNPDVSNGIRRLWQRLVPGDERGQGAVPKNTFLYLELRLREALCGDEDVPFSLRAMVMDFQLAAASSGESMSYSSFVSSMLELADNWTVTNTPEEYASFLRDIITRCFSCVEHIPSLKPGNVNGALASSRLTSLAATISPAAKAQQRKVAAELRRKAAASATTAKKSTSGTGTKGRSPMNARQRAQQRRRSSGGDSLMSLIGQRRGSLLRDDDTESTSNNNNDDNDGASSSGSNDSTDGKAGRHQQRAGENQKGSFGKSKPAARNANLGKGGSSKGRNPNRSTPRLQKNVRWADEGGSSIVTTLGHGVVVGERQLRVPTEDEIIRARLSPVALPSLSPDALVTEGWGRGPRPQPLSPALLMSENEGTMLANAHFSVNLTDNDTPGTSRTTSFSKLAKADAAAAAATGPNTFTEVEIEWRAIPIKLMTLSTAGTRKKVISDLERACQKYRVTPPSASPRPPSSGPRRPSRLPHHTSIMANVTSHVAPDTSVLGSVHRRMSSISTVDGGSGDNSPKSPTPPPSLVPLTGLTWAVPGEISVDLGNTMTMTAKSVLRTSNRRISLSSSGDGAAAAAALGESARRSVIMSPGSSTRSRRMSKGGSITLKPRARVTIKLEEDMVEEIRRNNELGASMIGDGMNSAGTV
eukprot:PhM_4_TR10875/c0_g1_i2/m.15930